MNIDGFASDFGLARRPSKLGSSMRIDEYEGLDGLDLAALLARKEVQPAELMDCALQLAEQRGKPLNALTYVQPETGKALAAEWRQRGIFRGIPFLLKDSGLPSRRFPSSLGSRLFDDVSYTFDATLAERFEAAGLVPFARTTVSELCMGPSTDVYKRQDFGRIGRARHGARGTRKIAAPVRRVAGRVGRMGQDVGRPDDGAQRGGECIDLIRHNATVRGGGRKARGSRDACLLG